MSALEKLSIDGGLYLEDDGGEFVFHVNTPHALIQAAGYLKHIAESTERVLFRGQYGLYGELCPSLYRGIRSRSAQTKRDNRIKKVVGSFAKTEKIFSNIPIHAHEALLQHYGIKTTWIDVVDNVWVAIWFAVNRSFTTGKHSEFLHFEERKPSEGDQFGYILLIAVDEIKTDSPQKGMMIGNGTETLDLRIAAPSVFLRPHAQHGLLFRRKNTTSGRDLDYLSTVRGTIRFDIANGLDWLGRGSMHSVRSLFPPPYFDQGYRILLDFELKDKEFGCIHHIGA